MVGHRARLEQQGQDGAHMVWARAAGQSAVHGARAMDMDLMHRTGARSGMLWIGPGPTFARSRPQTDIIPFIQPAKPKVGHHFS